jgi:hypothetical protein
MKLEITNFRDGQPPAAYEAALCGSISGAFSAAVTTPLDVLKTRLMLASPSTSQPVDTPLPIDPPWHLFTDLPLSFSSVPRDDTRPPDAVPGGRISHTLRWCRAKGHVDRNRWLFLFWFLRKSQKFINNQSILPSPPPSPPAPLLRSPLISPLLLLSSLPEKEEAQLELSSPLMIDTRLLIIKSAFLFF